MASRLQDVIQRGLAASRPLATLVAPGTLYYSTDTAATDRSDGSTWQTYSDAGTGSGDVVGPGSATDNAAARFDGTTGKLIQNSVIIISDAGLITFPDDVTQVFNPGTNNAGINVGAMAGDPATPDNGDIWYDSTANELTARVNGVNVVLAPRYSAITMVIDGSGVVITTGVKGFLEIPFACTIVGVTLLSSDGSVTSGSIVIDIWKDTYANYPPTVADTITAAAKPTISTATKSQDTTLTGWTTTIAAGDILGFNVDSVTSLTKVTLVLKVRMA